MRKARDINLKKKRFLMNEERKWERAWVGRVRTNKRLVYILSLFLIPKKFTLISK